MVFAPELTQAALARLAREHGLGAEAQFSALTSIQARVAAAF